MGRRKGLRKVNGRPGFITAKAPGLLQPNEVQIWTLKGAQGQGGETEGGKGFRDRRSTEPRKVGNATKPRKTQQRKKRQIC